MNDVTGFEENGWKLLQSSDVPVEIWSEFQSDAPNIKVFKEWLLGEYFKQSGINIDIDSAAHQELKVVAAWLGFQQANSGLVLNFRRHPRWLLSGSGVLPGGGVAGASDELLM